MGARGNAADEAQVPERMGTAARSETFDRSDRPLAPRVRWLHGKSSGGPPGSITIRRGLDSSLPSRRLSSNLNRNTKCDEWSEKIGDLQMRVHRWPSAVSIGPFLRCRR